MTRLLLHAGAHKTGTTSIQEVLAANRGRLRRNGVLYPGGAGILGRARPHHRFAHGLVHEDGPAAEASRAWIAAVRDRAAGFDTVVLSSEPLYRHVDGQDAIGFAGVADYWDRRRAYLARVAAILEGFAVEVLLYLREREDFVASYVADLHRTGRWSGDAAAFRQAFAPMLDYDRQVALFREIFPRVTLVDYDRWRDEGGSVPPFFAALGVPPPPGAGAVWTRRRPRKGAAAESDDPAG